jgi:RNA-directed DNA polymerase
VKLPWATHFLVITPSKEIADEVREIIHDFLAIRGLELSPEKTVITHIDDGFDFLGWNCATRSCKRDCGLIRPLSA